MQQPRFPQFLWGMSLQSAAVPVQASAPLLYHLGSRYPICFHRISTHNIGNSIHLFRNFFRQVRRSLLSVDFSFQTFRTCTVKLTLGGFPCQMITAFFATDACNRFNHLFRIQRQHFLLFKLNKITGRPVQNSAFAFFVRLSVFFSPHRQNPKPFAAKRKNKRIFQAFCLYRIVLSDFSFCKQYPVIMIHRIIRLSIPAPCKVNAICQSIWITPLLRKSCIHHNSCFFFAINSFHFFFFFRLSFNRSNHNALFEIFLNERVNT